MKKKLMNLSYGKGPTLSCLSATGMLVFFLCQQYIKGNLVAQLVCMIQRSIRMVPLPLCPFGWYFQNQIFSRLFELSKIAFLIADQPIVQVRHSHNPFSPRRISFNYSCRVSNSAGLKANIQSHVLFCSIIHTRRILIHKKRLICWK